MRERRDADVALMAFTGATVDPARFRDSNDRYPGHWKPDEEPSPFPETPEGSVLGAELIALTRRELDKLPERQRLVGRCATCSGWTPPRSASYWTSAWPTSAFSYIAGELRSGKSSKIM